VSSSLEDNNASSFHRTFIASSFLVEVLGGKNVDLGIPKILGRFGESL
jgi:hypothetical protein